MKYLLLSFLIVLVGCQRTTTLNFDGKEYQIDNSAIALNDKAVITVSENFDSLDYAIRLLGQSIQIDSNYYVAYQNKINHERDLERYDFGIPTIQAFIKRFPDNPSGYVILGLRNEKKGNLDEAKRNYQKALGLTVKSYKRRQAPVDSVKDGLWILTYLTGDTTLAEKQFEKFKKEYDSLNTYDNKSLKEIIQALE